MIKTFEQHYVDVIVERAGVMDNPPTPEQAIQNFRYVCRSILAIRCLYEASEEAAKRYANQVPVIEILDWEEAKQTVAVENGHPNFSHLEWLSDRGGIQLDDAYKRVAELLINGTKPEGPDA